MGCSCSDLCKLILAILLPPLAVFIDQGCNINLLINIILTILGFFPGLIHAIWVIYYAGR